jgi:hypothetical protein
MSGGGTSLAPSVTLSIYLPSAKHEKIPYLSGKEHKKSEVPTPKPERELFTGINGLYFALRSSNVGLGPMSSSALTG